MAKRTRKPAAKKPQDKGRVKAGPRPAPSRAVRAASSPTPGAAGGVYQIKITLDHVRPPVWRRVLVKDCTLTELHDIIQISMGWYGAHLHLFEVGGEEYGDPEQWEDADPWGESEVADEGRVKLSQLEAWGVKKFRYVYDMGDDWRHTIQIERTVPAESGVRYPRCVAGARACPPEDCGGPWGYGDLLQALRKPTNPRQKELLEWIGGEFDPEEFDPEEVNEALS